MLKKAKVSLILPILLAFGCATPPTQEIDIAKAALNGASKAEANVYAERSFQTAQDTLNAALEHIAQQEKKWFKNCSHNT